MSFLEKEAQHVEGFAKECAVVTHYRLKSKDGKSEEYLSLRFADNAFGVTKDLNLVSVEQERGRS